MFNVKLSLVTSTGLLLASKPESLDETREILATGLLTALISFSKEVHQRELQSISYHDRTVSFLRVKDFFVIIEIIGEETQIPEEQLTQLLQTVKQSSVPLLTDADANMLTEGESELIIEKCLQDLYQMQFSVVDQPLNTAVISYFTIKHSKKGWEIVDKTGSGAHIPLIALMLDTYHAHLKLTDKLYGLITSIPDEDCTTYTIVNTDGETSQVGILKLPEEFNLTLFRLTPMLTRILDILSRKREKLEMGELLNTLREIDDPGNRLSRINVEDLSIAFLDRTIGKNIERVIYPIVTGDTILVVGDKPTVRLVIDTLALFTQHLMTSVNAWVTEEDFNREGKCDLDSRICGMSYAMYTKLVESGSIDEFMTTVDLKANRVKGTKVSQYFKKLFDKIKNLRTPEIASSIYNELEILVSTAVHITSFGLVDKDKGKKRLKEYLTKSQINVNIQKKAVELAVKINPLLEHLL